MNDELRKAVDLINARQSAAEFMLLALALALVENEVLPAAKVLDAAKFIMAFCYVTESPLAGEACKPSVSRLEAIAEKEPRFAFRALIAMHLETAAHQRDALRTWLASASQGEIVEDLDELLRKLSGKSGSSPPPPRPRSKRK